MSWHNYHRSHSRSHHHHSREQNEDREAVFRRSSTLPVSFAPIAQTSPDVILRSIVTADDPISRDVSASYCRVLSVLRQDKRDARVVSPMAGMTMSEISHNASSGLNMLTESRHKTTPTEGYSFSLFYSHTDHLYAWTLFLGFEVAHGVPPAPYGARLRDLVGQHPAFRSLYWPVMNDNSPPVLQVSIMWRDQLLAQFVVYGYTGPADCMIRRAEWFEEVAAALTQATDRDGLVILIASYIGFEVHIVSVPLEGRVLAITTNHTIVATDKAGVVFELRASPRGSMAAGLTDLETIDMAWWARDRNMICRLSFVPREYLIVAHLNDITGPLSAARSAKGRIEGPDQRLDSMQLFNAISHAYHLTQNTHPSLALITEATFQSIENPHRDQRHFMLIRPCQNRGLDTIAYFSSNRQIPLGPVVISAPDRDGSRQVVRIPARLEAPEPTRPQGFDDYSVPKPPPAHIQLARRPDLINLDIEDPASVTPNTEPVIREAIAKTQPPIIGATLNGLNLEGVGAPTGKPTIGAMSRPKTIATTAAKSKALPPPLDPKQVAAAKKNISTAKFKSTPIKAPPLQPQPRPVDLTQSRPLTGPMLMGGSTPAPDLTPDGTLTGARPSITIHYEPAKIAYDTPPPAYEEITTRLSKEFLKRLRLQASWIDTPGGKGLVIRVLNTIYANQGDGPIEFNDDEVWQMIAMELMEMKKENSGTWGKIDLSKIPERIPEDAQLDPQPASINTWIEPPQEETIPLDPSCERPAKLQDLVQLNADQLALDPNDIYRPEDPSQLAVDADDHSDDGARSYISGISTHASEILVDAAEIDSAAFKAWTGDLAEVVVPIANERNPEEE